MGPTSGPLFPIKKDLQVQKSVPKVSLTSSRHVLDLVDPQKAQMIRDRAFMRIAREVPKCQCPAQIVVTKTLGAYFG